MQELCFLFIDTYPILCHNLFHLPQICLLLLDQSPIAEPNTSLLLNSPQNWQLILLHFITTLRIHPYNCPLLFNAILANPRLTVQHIAHIHHVVASHFIRLLLRIAVVRRRNSALRKFAVSQLIYFRVALFEGFLIFLLFVVADAWLTPFGIRLKVLQEVRLLLYCGEIALFAVGQLFEGDYRSLLTVVHRRKTDFRLFADAVPSFEGTARSKLTHIKI